MRKYQRANNICSIWPLKALIWGHIRAILKKKMWQSSAFTRVLFVLQNKPHKEHGLFEKKKTPKKQVVQSQHLLYMLLQLHSVHACTSFLLTCSVLFTRHSAFFSLFLCVCVCACIPLCKRVYRVYLYVGHLVAIRVNHPSFLRLAVSHKLTWTHTMRHTQLLLEHDSALDGVGKKYWQPSRGQNGGGDGTRKGRMKDRQREGMKVEKQEERFQDVWNGLSHKNRRTW